MASLGGVHGTRQGCGLYDLAARGRLGFRGKDRVRFLQGMVTNDVQKLGPGQGCHALALTAKGRIVADLVLYRDEDALFAECDPGPAEPVRAALDRYVITDDVTIAAVPPEEVAELGVAGVAAAAALGAAGLDVAGLEPYGHRVHGALRVAQSPELGLPGFHVFGPPASLASLADRLREGGAIDLTAEELDVLSLEAGRPRFGVDFTDDVLPVEVGYEDAISFQKGCYVGQEVVVRATARGAVKHKIVGLLVDGDDVPAPRAPVSAEARADAGHVTRAARSPTLGRILALAYLWRDVWEPGTPVRVALPGDRSATATVAALPFVTPPKERS